MRRAGIDLGTNSFLMTIAEMEDGTLQGILEEKLFTVRLGEEFEPSLVIQPAAWQRAIDALMYFHERCQHHGLTSSDVRLAGTSALRRAKNGDEFVEEVAKRFDFHIEIITGEEEALTSWKGALSGLSLPSENAPCLIDIGGGSTEFTWNGGHQAQSFPIGALKLRDSHIHHDPPLPEEIEKIKETTQAQLQKLPQIPTPNPMLAVAGTATTLAAIANKIEPYDGDLVHGQLLTLDEIESQISLFMSMDLQKRQEIVGLSPARADIIIAGAIILATAIRHFGVSQILVSDRGIRFGMLHPKASAP